MKKNIFGVFLLIFMYGCSTDESKITPESLKDLVRRAAEGNITANDSLSGIFSDDAADRKLLEVKTDTLTLDGTGYLAVAALFSNTVENRFAIYDEHLNCFLIDRSLNGNMEVVSKNQSGFGYFGLEEHYFTSDSIELKRFSIYRGDTSGFNLSFRTFTMMQTADTVFQHNIYEITSEVIRTNITAPVFSGLNNFIEEYPYDPLKNIYDVRKEVYFDEFVSSFISSVSDTIHRFIKPVEKENELSSVFHNTSGEIPDYYLNLNEDWKEVRNFSYSGDLKKELTGSRFINERLSSDIYVFGIPFYEEAEIYIKADFNNLVSGNYIVRYTDEYSIGKKIEKYFEYKCKSKKYLLILSALGESYDIYKPQYSDIINTFYINC